MIVGAPKKVIDLYWLLPDDPAAAPTPVPPTVQRHPHLHLLTTEGGKTAEGSGKPLPEWDGLLLMRLFRERLPARLVESHAISPELVSRLVCWKHPGFSAHAEWPTEMATDRHTSHARRDDPPGMIRLQEISDTHRAAPPAGRTPNRATSYR